MARIHGFLQTFTGRIQMDSLTWLRISDRELESSLGSKLT